MRCQFFVFDEVNGILHGDHYHLVQIHVRFHILVNFDLQKRQFVFLVDLQLFAFFLHIDHFYGL